MPATPSFEPARRRCTHTGPGVSPNSSPVSHSSNGAAHQQPNQQHSLRLNPQRRQRCSQQQRRPHSQLPPLPKWQPTPQPAAQPRTTQPAQRSDAAADAGPAAAALAAAGGRRSHLSPHSAAGRHQRQTFGGSRAGPGSIAGPDAAACGEHAVTCVCTGANAVSNGAGPRADHPRPQPPAAPGQADKEANQKADKEANQKADKEAHQKADKEAHQKADKEARQKADTQTDQKADKEEVGLLHCDAPRESSDGLLQGPRLLCS